MKSGEIFAIVGVVAWVLVLALWLYAHHQRRKFKELSRLPIIDTPLGVSDWRFLVPPEKRTPETERVVRWGR